MQAIREQRWNLIAVGIVLLAYIAALVAMPRHVFWSPDEGIRFIMVRALKWGDAIHFVIPYRGAALDPAWQFYPNIDGDPFGDNIYPYPRAGGQVHFAWSIAFPFLASIFYATLGIAGIYLIPLISGWLTTVVVWRMMLDLKPARAPHAILLAGLGTPMAFYSLTFWEHTLVAWLALVALWLAMRALVRPAAFVFAAPLLIGIVILRMEMLAFSCAVALAWLIVLFSDPRITRIENRIGERRVTARVITKFALYAICFGAGLWLLFNGVNLIAPRYQSNLPRYAQIAADVLARAFTSPEFLLRYFGNLPTIFVDAAVNVPGGASAWDWLALLAIAASLSAFFISSRRFEMFVLVPAWIVLLLTSGIVLLSSQPYRALHGIFLCAPFLAVGAWVAAHARQQSDPRLWFMVLVGMLYLAASTVMILITKVNHLGEFMAGLEWGPRYLLPLYPIGAMLAVIALSVYAESVRPQWLKRAVIGIVVLMMVAGVQFQVRGAWMLYNDKQNIATWQTVLETAPTTPVVTDVWWLPAVLATYFSDHEMYVVHPQNASAWFTQASAQSVKRCVFVSQIFFDVTYAERYVGRVIELNRRAAGDMLFTQLQIAPADAQSPAR